MNPTIDIVTLGVSDPERARDFFEGAFGADVSADAKALTVNLGPHASRFELRDWDDLATEVGEPAQSIGFRGFTLSYILGSAEDVDRVVGRAEQHGGRVTKPARNAAWGYSAYVTDPSGYLWKIASSKRRPLIGRKRADVSNGHAVTPQEVPVTIGVADMSVAKRFYADGLGLPVKKAFGNKFVMFKGEDGRSDLGMYKRQALARDAAVAPEGSGFRGFTMTYVVESAARVDELLARAAAAGGTIVKPGAGTDRGGYRAYFADLDGNLWHLASNSLPAGSS